MVDTFVRRPAPSRQGAGPAEESQDWVQRKHRHSTEDGRRPSNALGGSDPCGGKKREGPRTCSDAPVDCLYLHVCHDAPSLLL